MSVFSTMNRNCAFTYNKMLIQLICQSKKYIFTSGLYISVCFLKIIKGMTEIESKARFLFGNKIKLYHKCYVIVSQLLL